MKFYIELKEDGVRFLRYVFSDLVKLSTCEQFLFIFQDSSITIYSCSQDNSPIIRDLQFFLNADIEYLTKTDKNIIKYGSRNCVHFYISKSELIGLGNILNKHVLYSKITMKLTIFENKVRLSENYFN